MFEELRNIMINAPDDTNRTEEQRQIINECLGQIKFFNEQYKDSPTQQSHFFKEYFIDFLIGQLEQFDPGSIIFFAGEKGTKLYILLDGIIELYRPIQNTANQQGQQESDPRALQRMSTRRSVLPLHLLLKQTNNNLNQLSEEDLIRQFIENEFQSKNEKIGKVFSGQCFGELALTMNKPRFATAKTSFEFKQTTYLASLNKIFFDSIQEVDSKVESLEKLFPNVPKNVLIRISYNFINKEYSHNQLIYAQNEVPGYFYIILSGEVRQEYAKKKVIDKRFTDNKYGLIKLLKNKKTLSQTIHLTVLEEGSLFGLEEVIAQIPRKCSARCISQKTRLYALPSECYFLQKNSIQENKTYRNLCDLSCQNLLRAPRTTPVRTIGDFDFAQWTEYST